MKLTCQNIIGKDLKVIIVIKTAVVEEVHILTEIIIEQVVISLPGFFCSTTSSA